MGSADFVCAAFFLSCDNFDGTRNVKNHLTNVKKNRALLLLVTESMTTFAIIAHKTFNHQNI